MSVYLLKLMCQKGISISSSTIEACTDLFATVTQLSRKQILCLGLPCAILWPLSLFCIIGILVSIYVPGSEGVWGFICKLLQASASFCIRRSIHFLDGSSTAYL